MKLSSVSFLVAGIFAGIGLHKMMEKKSLGCHSRPAPGGHSGLECMCDQDCMELGPHYSCWFGTCAEPSDRTALNGYLGKGQGAGRHPGGYEDKWVQPWEEWQDKPDENGQDDGRWWWWDQDQAPGSSSMCMSDRECVASHGRHSFCNDGVCETRPALAGWRPPTFPDRFGRRMRF